MVSKMPDKLLLNVKRPETGQTPKLETLLTQKNKASNASVRMTHLKQQICFGKNTSHVHGQCHTLVIQLLATFYSRV